MDSRLLSFYNQELDHIREMAVDFAQAYPKIASRLTIKSDQSQAQEQVQDPYVERLIECFAFLAARVQLELDLQYPTFTQHLLEIVYPHYTAPTPSMTIARFDPDPALGGLEDGFLLPRHTVLRSVVTPVDTTPVMFRTAHDVRLWPLKIVECEYIDGRGELVAAGIAGTSEARAAIRIRLGRIGGGSVSDLSIDQLTLYLAGGSAQPWRIYENICKDSVGLVARSTDRRADWVEHLGDVPIEPIGFDPEQALLPYPKESFDGYRLLQEFFALPQRFFFIRLRDLQKGVARCEGEEIDLYILLAENQPELVGKLEKESFDLFAAPAINLFEKRCDRLHIRETDIDHHVVPERTTPLNYEIHHLLNVTGIMGHGEDDMEFRPFYSTDDMTAAGDDHEAFYAIKRRMRERSQRQKLKGARTTYLGTEIFLSLVDRKQAPYPRTLEQLAVTAMCTNRDLSLILPVGRGTTDFTLPAGGPVSSVRAIVQPTRPRESLAQGDAAWRLISHLSLNYLSIADTDTGEGAEALRELLAIYSPRGDVALSRQIEGIISIQSRPIVRRIQDRVLSTAVRGIEIGVGFDENAFEGSGVYLIGAVLERFFAKYVALNSFTETYIHSQDRGEIARWPARSGKRLLI